MWAVAAFYRFVDMKERDALRARLKDIGRARSICGSVLLAEEGVNGTIAGPSREDVDAILALLPIEADDVKWSEASVQPFYKYKVRLKKEIITMKTKLADPNKQVGRYVTASDWNALIEKPETLVLDTRNAYETEIGTFQNAVDPKIAHFSHFKDFVDSLPEEVKDRPVAMFCTGGIRCEKASSYMMAKGFKDVFHLKGGILKYLEVTPPEKSLWQGECFVFDKRVALTHGLEEAVI